MSAKNFGRLVDGVTTKCVSIFDQMVIDQNADAKLNNVMINNNAVVCGNLTVKGAIQGNLVTADSGFVGDFNLPVSETNCPGLCLTFTAAIPVSKGRAVQNSGGADFEVSPPVFVSGSSEGWIPIIGVTSSEAVSSGDPVKVVVAGVFEAEIVESINVGQALSVINDGTGRFQLWQTEPSFGVAALALSSGMAGDLIKATFDVSTSVIGSSLIGGGGGGGIGL